MHNKLDCINQVIWCIGLSRKEHLSENDRGSGGNVRLRFQFIASEER